MCEYSFSALWKHVILVIDSFVPAADFTFSHVDRRFVYIRYGTN